MTQKQQEIKKSEEPVILIQELGRTLAALRSKACLSQEQVAQKLGISSRSHIAAIEAGKVVPRTDTLIKLLTLYECSLTIKSASGEVVLSWDNEKRKMSKLDI